MSDPLLKLGAAPDGCFASGCSDQVLRGSEAWCQAIPQMITLITMLLVREEGLIFMNG
ncbi:MAG: hypothetical protein V4592_14620 [Bacteroidota bacterium]